MTTTAIATPDRKPRCRYLDRFANRCTAEVVEENAEIDLCLKHLGRALELFRRRAGGK